MLPGCLRRSELADGSVTLSQQSDVFDRSERAEQVEQTLERGFPLLFFPAGLEGDFQRDCQNRRLTLITEIGLGAILLFAGILLADWLLTPETLGLALWLRTVAFAPVILMGLWLVRALRQPRISEWLVAAAGVYAIALTSVILVSSESKWGYARLVEINIIVVYTCTLARFWPAVCLGAVSMLAHSLLAWHLPDFTQGLLSVNTTLLAVVILLFTLYGNYTLERDERIAYLLAQREKALQDALEASHEQLARLATTDALTEVANRRSADEYLEQSWQHAQARRLPMALVMVDIDHFKRYNDRYGHQAGDRCLQAVARALSSCSRRAGDLVARMGGEEFLVIMVDVDQGTALSVAQRMRDAVQALGLNHAGSNCAPVVTVSVGVSTARPGPDVTRAALMRAADEALYAAKASGRNRVCTLGRDGSHLCLDATGRAAAGPTPEPGSDGGQRVNGPPGVAVRGAT